MLTSETFDAWLIVLGVYLQFEYDRPTLFCLSGRFILLIFS